MFIVFTADDAIQSYTLNAVNQFLAQRKNPNGCQPKMTYYTSLDYTNYTLVTGPSKSSYKYLPNDPHADWYVAGNEIADHTYVLSFSAVSRRMWILVLIRPVCRLAA